MTSLHLAMAGGFICAAAALSSMPTPAIGAANDSIIPDASALTHEYVPNALFLRFREDLPQAQRGDVLELVDGTIRQAFWLVPGLMSIDTTMSVADALKVLGTRGDVLQYVEPIYIVHAFETIPNDPLFNQLYGMEQINAPAAWDDHTGNQDFIVCVIDTGLDYTHQDIASNAWNNPGEIPGNGLDDDGNGYVDDMFGYDFYNNDSNPMDDNNHGTHCGGTIGGQGNNGVGVAGVCWNVTLVGAKFLSGGGSGSTEGAVASVQYCAANQFKVSNNSWGGGGFSQSLYDGIQNAGDQFGHIFVAAAGNGGNYGASYPAAYDCTNIISVGASDQNENKASFSQYHPVEVDLAAPGVDVVSSVPGNNYDSYSGTSMATPHVSGGVALVYSLMGDATAAEVKDIIMSSARPVDAWAGNCVTGGILDVDAALEGTFLGPQFQLLTSIPDEMDPNTSLELSATLDPREDTIIAGSVKLHYRATGGEWTTADMVQDGLNTWTAVVPGVNCDDTPGFYLSCQGQTAGTVELPSGGATNAHSWIIGHVLIAYEDNGQSNGDWSVQTDAADGGWNRGVPINCQRGDPPSDFDGSGACWLTDNSSGDGCNSDVDEGSTILTSQVIDLDGVASPILSYARWFHNSYGAAPYTDSFLVQIKVDGGGWSTLEIVGPNGADVDGGWVQVSWDLNDIVGAASTVQLQFTASDIGSSTQSVVEAGVDAISVSARECDDVPVCLGDLNGDMVVDVEDLLVAIDGFGTLYGVEDILDILGAFGNSC
jgi:subtilisin family serine protease